MEALAQGKFLSDVIDGTGISNRTAESEDDYNLERNSGKWAEVARMAVRDK